jgi:hypothetical protein
LDIAMDVGEVLFIAYDGLIVASVPDLGCRLA